jgi:hypothetical protein
MRLLVAAGPDDRRTAAGRAVDQSSGDVRHNVQPGVHALHSMESLITLDAAA